MGWIVQRIRGFVSIRIVQFIVDILTNENKLFDRCHDIHMSGHFKKFYFECAPGTYFADELDLCVGGSAEDNCKNLLIPAGCSIDNYGNCDSRDVCSTQYTGRFCTFFLLL